MHRELERRAEALCRDVGNATMLAAVLPGLGALTGLVIMPLVAPQPDPKLAPAFGFLALAAALFYLGRAVRLRKRWSFRAVKVLFAGVAIASFVGLLVAGEGKKVGFVITVGVPLCFVGFAHKAERAVEEVEQARRSGI